jgi:hypothetical protein
MKSGFPKCIATLLLLSSGLDLQAEQPRRPAAQLVSDALNNELTTRPNGDHFAYTSHERSTRTGHHLWVESVIETEKGTLRRLISIDGQPLSADKAQAEDRRVARLVSHPDEPRQANADRESDEKSREKTIRAMATAFIFDYDGEDNGCTRIKFEPSPTFKPSTYQERILHNLVGTLSVNEAQKRICGINATLSQRVEIGFGLFGSLEQGGRIHVARVQTQSGSWESAVIEIHLVGRMLVVRSLSQDIDETRTDIRDVPPHLTPAQAVGMLLPAH